MPVRQYHARMIVGDLLEALDAAIPFENAGVWDPVGLQVGDRNATVGSVGVCHEVSSTVIADAARDNIDVIVSYHPLLFRPTTAFVAGPNASGRALELAAAGISLIVVHTAFDVLRPGTADALLNELGLVAAEETFAAVDEEGGSDIGRVSQLRPSTDVASLVQQLADVTGSQPRVAGDHRTEVTRIGVVPGSGGSFVDSIGIDIDCFISGDISHHAARALLDRGVVVIDAGHTPSERPGVRALYALVSSVAPNCVALADNPDPWRT